MTTTPIELPDWVRGHLLLGRLVDGTIVPVLIDSAGNINILLRGEDAGGTVRTVRVDGAGQLYAILRGADNVDVAVDEHGFMTAMLIGHDAGDTIQWVRTDDTGQILMVPRGQSGNYMLVDASGYLSAILKGEKPDTSLGNVALDASGQMIMVPRGQSGNYMSIDASGYMTAVLKGAHDSTLTTIGVDANGRIDAFLMDGEDQWGQILRIGNADLAARLGAPTTHDYRGQILWSNMFGSGVGGIKVMSNGTGAAVSIDPEYSLTEGYSLKLKGGSNGDRFAMAYGYLGRPPSSRVGISVAVSGYAERTSIALRSKPGEIRYMGTLRYTWATNQLTCQNAAGGYTLFDTKYLYGSTSVFNLFKLVIDTTEQRYARVLVNDTEYDMSAHILYNDAGGVSGTMEFEIETVSRAGLNDYQLVDRIILTVNEP